MEMIVFLIFLAVMCAGIANRGKKNRQNQPSKMPQRPVQQRPMQQRPMQQRPMQPQPSVYAQQMQMSAYMQQKEEPYDILERAANNVREIQKEDEPPVIASIPADMHAQTQERTPLPCEQSERMKKVEELIVTGYSGNLNFERDFVAEGIDMLNHYEIR